MLKYIYIFVFTVCLLACNKDAKMSDIIHEEKIFVYGYAEYDDVVKKFKISLEEAINIAKRHEGGYPIGEHYFVIGEYYVFSILANKKGEIECSGLYVNGNNGEAIKKESTRIFGKGDRDWKTIYSLKGIRPAKTK